MQCWIARGDNPSVGREWRALVAASSLHTAYVLHARAESRISDVNPSASPGGEDGVIQDAVLGLLVATSRLVVRVASVGRSIVVSHGTRASRTPSAPLITTRTSIPAAESTSFVAWCTGLPADRPLDAGRILLDGDVERMPDNSVTYVHLRTPAREGPTPFLVSCE